jgi:hypothetical protein
VEAAIGGTVPHVVTALSRARESISHQGLETGQDTKSSVMT